MGSKVTLSRVTGHLKQFKRDLAATFRHKDGINDDQNPRTALFSDKRLSLQDFNGIHLMVMRDEPVVQLMHSQASYAPDRFIAAIVNTLTAQNEPMIHLDIGTNYGFDLCHTARHMFAKQADAHAAGFDPGVVRDLVPHNLALNSLAGKVSFFPMAMADKPGFLALHTEQDRSENNRLFNPSKLHSRTSLAAVTTIDTYVSALNKPSAPIFMKIDTQGAEPEIFAGAVNTLANHPCVIISEFTPWAIETRHNPVAFLQTLMSTHDVYDLRHDRGTCVPATDPASFTAEVKARPETWTDILLLPKNAPQISPLIKAHVSSV